MLCESVFWTRKDGSGAIGSIWGMVEKYLIITARKSHFRDSTFSATSAASSVPIHELLASTHTNRTFMIQTRSVQLVSQPTSTSQLEGPDMTRKAKSELFSAFFKRHHLANWMYHRTEQNEANRSSLLPFEGSQI